MMCLFLYKYVFLWCYFWHRKETCFLLNISKWPEDLKRILIKTFVILSLEGIQKNGYASKTHDMVMLVFFLHNPLLFSQASDSHLIWSMYTSSDWFKILHWIKTLQCVLHWLEDRAVNLLLPLGVVTDVKNSTKSPNISLAPRWWHSLNVSPKKRFFSSFPHLIKTLRPSGTTKSNWN